MKHVVLVATLVASLSAAAVVSGQTAPTTGSSLGSVTLSKRVMADGQALAAGTYQVRLSADVPKPGVGQTAEAERYVEFVRGGKVVGREVATVVSTADIASIVKGPKPANGGSRVDTLKGDDYVRVWINRGGMNYIIHMPPAAS
jgi:hypothetical protein